MLNQESIRNFVGYLRSERDATENTISNYERDVRKFAEWFNKPLVTTRPLDVQQHMSEFLASGAGGLSGRRRLFGLRHYFRYLIEEGEIKKDPTCYLPSPRAWKKLPKTISEADLNKMVQSLGNTPLDVRDRAILLTLYGSGLRVSELIALNLEDLDLEAGQAKVWNGKGRKDGVVVLSPPAIAALRAYLADVRTGFNRHNHATVFLGRQYRQQLTRQLIHKRVRKIGKAALGKSIAVHQLRHGFATALVDGGADVRDVQALMRHSSVDTTAIYIHTDLNYLRRNYYASHPRARIATQN